MVRNALLITLACAAIAAQVVGISAHAAVPVVDSQGSRPTGSTTTGPAATSTSQPAVRSYGVEQSQAGVASSEVAAAPPSESVGQGGASELFMRFQQLESDVSELRGLVEEQSHLIDRLTKQQQEQYLDLDRRIVLAQQGQASAGNGASTPGMPPAGSTGEGSGGAGQAPTLSSNNSERDAYTIAFEFTKQKRFPEAINAFNEMLVKYPNGQLSGNAFYWLGELYLALPQPNLEKSRQSFSQVINLYQSNPKISDAMYKLGVVYHQLGDRTAAIEYLTRVQSQYPGTPAARLAQSYAAELR
jgi:tol-pal system protein YbgF